MGEGIIRSLNGSTLCYYKDGYIYPNFNSTTRQLGRYKEGELYIGYDQFPSYKYEGNYVTNKGWSSVVPLITVEHGNIYRGYSNVSNLIGRVYSQSGEDYEAACAAYVVLKDQISNNTFKNSTATQSQVATRNAYSSGGGDIGNIGMGLSIVIGIALIALVILTWKYFVNIPVIASFVWVVVSVVRYLKSRNKISPTFVKILLGCIRGLAIGVLCTVVFVFAMGIFLGLFFQHHEFGGMIAHSNVFIIAGFISGIFKYLHED